MQGTMDASPSFDTMANLQSFHSSSKCSPSFDTMANLQSFHSSSKCSGAKEPMISSSSAFETSREGPAHQPLRLDWQGYNARKESLSRRQNCVLFMGSVVCISQSRFCDSCELFEYILSIMNDYKYQIMY
jgi:hypothetical protein